MSVEMLKLKRIILDADIKAAQGDIMEHMPSTAAYFKPACKEAAGGGVASLAPSRPSKANKPFRARFDVAREAWRKQGIERWASKTSDKCRQKYAGRLRRPLAIIDPIPHTFARGGNHALTGYCHAARCGAIHASRLRRCPTFVNTLYIF